MARLNLNVLVELIGSLKSADATDTFDQVVKAACLNQDVSEGQPQPIAVIRLHLKYILYFAREPDYPDLVRYKSHSKKPIDPWYFDQLPPLLVKEADAVQITTAVLTHDPSKINTDKVSGQPEKDNEAPPRTNFRDLPKDEKTLLRTRIVNFGLSTRAQNVLSIQGAELLGDAIAQAKKFNIDWSQIPRVGKQTQSEIENFLKPLFFKYGSLSGWTVTAVRDAIGESGNQSENVNATEFAALSSENKAYLLRKVDELQLSTRATRALRLRGAEYLGDAISQAKKFNVTWSDAVSGVGKKIGREIEDILAPLFARYGRLAGWVRPSDQQTTHIIINTLAGSSLEDEVQIALEQIPQAHVRRIISARYAIGEFSHTHTLQELGDKKFWPDSRGRSREYARQVIKKGFERVVKARINFDSLNRLKQVLLQKSVWDEPGVRALMADLAIECQGSIFTNLIALDLFSGKRNLLTRHSKKNTLLLTNSSVLSGLDEKLVRKDFDDGLVKVKKAFIGKTFIELDEVMRLLSVREGDEYLLDSPPISLSLHKSETDKIFVARKLNSFQSHKSYLDTMITKIFSLTASVNLSVAMQALIRSSKRYETVQVPNEDRILLESYLTAHPCLDLRDGTLFCEKRPSKSLLNDTDKAIIACAREYGEEMQTDLLHQWLLREMQCTEASARQKVLFSPVLVSIKNGLGTRFGLKKLICRLSEIDEVSTTDIAHTAELIVEVKNGALLKQRGRAITSEAVRDGCYTLKLSNGNDLGQIQVRDQTLMDLAPIANAFDSDLLTFVFDQHSQVAMLSL